MLPFFPRYRVRPPVARCAIALLPTVVPTLAASAQAARGELRELAVHSPALERNTIGISADRAVSVYLPPSYRTGSRRYPVIYLLHGIMDSHRTWTRPWGPPHPPHPGFSTIAELMDAGIAKGTLAEMIVVMPDADKTCHYTDSPVKGGWGTFVAHDLVAFVDRTFRTVPASHARGIMGHSMGGHGALKLVMRHPGVFDAVYAMNPSLLGWGGDVSEDNPILAAVDGIESLADVTSADFYVQAVVGVGQCFAPDDAAPLKTRATFTTRADGGRSAGPARDLWTRQMPLYMAPGNAESLRRLRGLRFDSAFEDEFSHIPITTRAFSRVLDSLGVTHTFEMYNGDHRNRLWGPEGRLLTHALPFFSRLLQVAPPAAIVSSLPADAARAQEDLWDAARRGDVKRAAEALRQGADLNALDTVSAESGGARSGRRALNYAALHNEATMVRWLVAQGADLHLTNRTGFTPLHHAAEKGSYHAAEALVQLGANRSARLPSGTTPLQLARQRRQSAVVRLLEKPLPIDAMERE